MLLLCPGLRGIDASLCLGGQRLFLRLNMLSGKTRPRKTPPCPRVTSGSVTGEQRTGRGQGGRWLAGDGKARPLQTRAQEGAPAWGPSEPPLPPCGATAPSWRRTCSSQAGRPPGQEPVLRLPRVGLLQPRAALDLLSCGAGWQRLKGQASGTTGAPAWAPPAFLEFVCPCSGLSPTGPLGLPCQH